jgi:hypothetical protein
VIKLEDALEPFIIKESAKWHSDLWQTLSKYKRQYLGFVLNGQKKIFINFFCDPFNIDWKRQLVSVFDGGDCFFRVTYDVASGTFSDLRLNGYA